MTGKSSSLKSNFDTLLDDRARLVRLLLAEKSRDAQEIRPYPRGDDAVQCVLLPTSSAQQRLWFIDQLAGRSTAYHMAVTLRLAGNLDERALQEALDAIVQRHESLRTVFVSVDGDPKQLINPECRFALRTVDLSDCAIAQRDAEMKLQMTDEANAPFDLSTGPLFRGRLLRLHATEHLLLLTMHHIISDGWSIEVLLNELAALYAAYHQGRDNPLVPLPIQYADYAQWQQQWVRREASAKQMEYWRSCLEGAPPQIDLPTDRPQPAVQSFRGESLRVALGERLSADLRAFARRYEMTPFMVLQAGWAILLSRLSGQEEVVIGTPTANRQRSELNALIGFFVNTLVLRVGVRGELGIEDFLRQVKQVMRGAYDHQDLPFELVVEAVQPQRSLSRNPLFQVMLSFQSTPQAELHMPELSVAIEESIDESAMFDLLLSLIDNGDEIIGKLKYATDLFDRSTVQRWMACFTELLNEIVGGAHDRIADVPFLPESERRLLRVDFNATARAFPSDRLIHELIEEQVRRAPETLAAVYGHQSLSYDMLNSRANQLARYLLQRGVGPDRLVGICVERGIEMVIGMLGIWKAGGAYVPLDPDYPPERLAYMLKDAAPTVLLTQEHLRAELPETTAEIVALDADWAQIAEHAIDNLNADDLRSSTASAHSHRLAYVIYTSGSTGHPKGVMVEHRNAVKLWQSLEPVYNDVSGCQRVGVNAPFSFDASVKQFVQLMSGRTLVLIPQESRLDAVTMLDLLREHRVDAIDCTPSQLRSWVAAGLLEAGRYPLRMALVGGEPIDAELWSTLAQSSSAKFFNVYGPTECTVDATVAPVSTAAAQPTIGRPLENTSIYILDCFGQLMPIGVAGEIHIGGGGVARGYLNRPELTATRFLVDPFSADPHARMYRSGDLGRWLLDGTVEYLGRNDDQVKIRGFRVELGEIGAQLALHPQVHEAVAVARGEHLGEKRLVAYVVPRDSAGEMAPPSVDELRTHLKAVLPEHMVPSAFVMIERLPLTPNGKLDHRSLPAPDAAAYVRRQYEAPRGEVEELLAGIWRQLLAVERVGRHDNFFELGGHSLLTMRMLDQLRRVGLSAKVKNIYESANLAALARTLGGDEAPLHEVPPNAIPPACEVITPQMLPLVDLQAEHIERLAGAVPGGARNIQDIYPLAPLQEGILFHHLLAAEGADPYVLSTLLEVASSQRLAQLIDALQSVIDRHDILRTAVLWEGQPRPLQVVHRKVALPVREVALDPDRDPIEQLKERMHQDRFKLDLRSAPLMQLEVAADTHREQHYVLLRLHHIVSDHVTREIVIEEVIAHLDGRAHALPDSVPYRNHVGQALAYARAHDAESFFRRKLEGVAEPTAPFALLNARGDGGEAPAEACQAIEPGLARRLSTQARRLNVSAATLFHAGWSLVVARTSGRNDVVFGSVLLGRLQGSAGLQRILGMFINTLPLRLRLEGQTAQELVAQTQRELTEVLNYEQASLAVAQRCSDIEGSAPLFTALFNYRHSKPAQDADWSGAAGISMLAAGERTNYPITLSVDDLGEGFLLTAHTDPRIDPHRVVGYLQTAIRSLVEALERAPSTSALDLQVLPSDERLQVVETFNATQAVYSQRKLVHELFEEQAQRAPDATAVECEAQRLTYAELNRRANQLAWHLRAKGVGPDQLVGICVERSLDMVIGLLGILKSGAAYIPLDPNYPPERLRHMVEDADPKVVLIQEHLREKVPTTAADVVALDALTSELETRPPSNVPARDIGLNSHHLVYVIYTSGSTGRPKGVAMAHRSMVNLIEWHAGAFETADERVLQFAALSFDVAFQEIFSTLCAGSTLVLIDEWIRKDARALAQLLQDRRIERLFVPPLMLQSLAEYATTQNVVPDALRNVITAGEQLRITAEIAALFERLSHCKLHNHYGPTETHVVTALTLPSEPRGWPALPSIGRPIANSQIYILDARREPVPLGVTGEIYIGGSGVARGYLGSQELSAQRFMENRFRSERGSRLYRTGDVGRWRPDGTIEYLGRNDHQVKIRGFRIELEEIETQLARSAPVREVAVVAREDVPGDKRLVAYVTLREGSTATAEELRAHLKAALPEHMVPSAFVTLQSFPLTPNGKLDRRALPAPELDAYASKQYQAPQGEVERILAGIWQDLLLIERVGRQDNFFELGGHSLLIIQMIERLRRRGLQAEVRGVFDTPTLAELASALSSESVQRFEAPPNLIPAGCQVITPQMLPLVTLEPEHIERIAASVPGGAGNIQDIYPLAPMQEGMLFHHLLHQDRGDVYVRPMLLSLTSRLQLDRFIAALSKVIERHDILRTAVLWEQLPQAVQVVQHRAALPVTELVLQRERDPLEQLGERMQSGGLKLDLRQAPLMNVEVAEDKSGRQWYALLRTHHLIFDNESLQIFLAEVWACMDGAAGLPVPVPYRQHVAMALAQGRARDAVAFFSRKLGDVDEPTVPFGLMDVLGEGNERLDLARDVIESDLSGRVRTQARRLGVSTAALFHAAWALVIAETSAREDIVFGSVLSGRLQTAAEAGQSLGMLINTLPLRLRLRDVTARAFVRQTHRELAELLDHGGASLAVAQRCSGISGSAPLFSALLNYTHRPTDVATDLREAAGIKLIRSSGGTNYPLALNIKDHGDGFGLEVTVDQRVEAARVLGYVHTAIRSLVEALERTGETPALALRILPEAELQLVLERFNDTQSPFPEHALIQELFEEHVSRAPQALSLACAGQRLSYQALNARANQLARYLRRRGVERGDRVGICFERSVETIVSMLGVLKAGAAYVPLDPTFPPERLAHMIEDSTPKLVLTLDQFGGSLGAAGVAVISLDRDSTQIGGEDVSNLGRGDLDPGDVAYVMYTSGSTGKPKGVMVCHSNVVNYATYAARRFDVASGDGSLVGTSLNFDLCLTGVYPPLVCGRAVRLCATDEDLSRALLEGWNYAPVKLTPTHLSMLSLPDATMDGRIRTLVLGGEQLKGSALRWWREHCPGTRIFNHYGPTETTIGCVVHEVTQDMETVVPIGRPIANARIYILNAQGAPAPIGVTGEIHIGGAGVARGYLNRPELTAERFLRDPFSPDPNARMYKTGDLGRWRADGSIEYLGRNDDQVKIRGFRVELGEIAVQLTQHAQIKEAAVLAVEDSSGEKRLVAYVVPEMGADATSRPGAEDLRAHLKAVLPEHMVPSAFVALDRLPLTANSKLDRRALPTPEFDDYVRAQFEAPQGDVEESLADVWRQVLGVDSVGRHDNFFELGGHSLHAIKLIARIVGLTNTSVPVVAVFKHPTIAQMATVVGAEREPRGQRVDGIEVEEGVI